MALKFRVRLPPGNGLLEEKYRAQALQQSGRRLTESIAVTEKIEVPAGAEMMIGAPAKPMPEATSGAIAELVAQIDGIQEAHLPQCYVPNTMARPGQILVLLLTPGANIQTVMERIGQGLHSILSGGEPLDIWPLQPPPDALLTEVRKAGCQIYQRQKSWWKFW